MDIFCLFVKYDLAVFYILKDFLKCFLYELCIFHRDNSLFAKHSCVGNASCDIREIKIVCGVDYETETGFYAENSYIAPPAGDTEPVAPPTSDVWWLPALPAIVSGLILCRKRRRKV